LTKVDVILLGLAALWVGFAALVYIVLRELGWARLRHRLGALFFVGLSVAGLPGAGALKIAWPHRNRVLALIIPHHSEPVVLPEGCAVFPANNVWNARVFSLPVHRESQKWAAIMQPERPVHLDFSMPYNIIHGEEAVTFVNPGAMNESDPGPYRIPDNAAVEGGEDSHAIVVDAQRCKLYELYAAKRTASHQWDAGSAAIFDLKANTLRPEGWTSADGAGLPIFPGLLRYDEMKSGRIAHALRFTTPRTQRKFLWPARHFASQTLSTDPPPMGARFRLRNSYDISGFSPEAQVILTALKEYGMILSDNGGPWFITGGSDSRFSRSLVKELGKVQGLEFEAVDVGALMIDKDSAAAKQ
jgi:hypothetical protein